MADEVFLEIVDEIDRLAEGRLILAAIHQDGLRAEHLRHLGQQRRAAVARQQIGRAAQQRVGGDAGQAVAAAAFEADDQLGSVHRLSLEGGGVGGQLVEEPHARFDFILHVLRDEEFHALGVVIAEHLLEFVYVVVFTAEAQHEHRARVRMAHHRGEQLLGVPVILAELAASVGVDEAVNAVHAVAVGRLRHALKRLGRAVDAADGVHNPDLVADAHAAVLAHIALERGLAIHGHGAGMRVIAVFQQAGEVGLDVVGVHPASR